VTRYYEPVCYYAQRKTSLVGTGRNLSGYETQPGTIGETVVAFLRTAKTSANEIKRTVM